MYGYAPKVGRFQCDLIPRNPLYGNEAHICLRLDVDIETYHISRSSLAHDTEWSPPEDEGYSGLEAGRYFQMTVVVQMYSYAVLINGYHFTTYQHRIPFYNEMTVSCSDHVRLEPYEYN